MTFNIQAERERRDALSKDTRNLLDNNTSTWTAENQKKYDENVEEIERINASITRHQKLLDLEAEKHFNAAGGREIGLPANKEQSLIVFDKWARGGANALSAEEMTIIRNTMSGNPSASPEQGGYTVPTTLAKNILEALKAFGGMRLVADVFSTSSGEPMSYPTSDGTNEEGEIVGENQSADDEDAKFGTLGLPVYKFSSKVITVPWELLQDGAADIEGFINKRLTTRLGRVTNRMYTVGSGNGQPMGIVTAAKVGVTGAVSALPAITYDNLVDLEHSVDPSYRANANWMFHDDMLQLIRKVKDDKGRPIFAPGYEQGNPGGAPDRLLNRNITNNQQMAAPAPGATSIAFGDFSYYKIRDVMGVTLFRFADSAYTKKGQVGFLAWMRSGGNLIDVGGAVKTFKHGAKA